MFLSFLTTLGPVKYIKSEIKQLFLMYYNYFCIFIAITQMVFFLIRETIISTY